MRIRDVGRFVGLAAGAVGAAWRARSGRCPSAEVVEPATPTLQPKPGHATFFRCRDRTRCHQRGALAARSHSPTWPTSTHPVGNGCLLPNFRPGSCLQEGTCANVENFCQDFKNGASVEMDAVWVDDGVRVICFVSTGGAWDYDMCDTFERWDFVSFTGPGMFAFARPGTSECTENLTGWSMQNGECVRKKHPAERGRQTAGDARVGEDHVPRNHGRILPAPFTYGE